MNPNPCLSCGACCTCHRVVFHWREADDATPDGVPVAMTRDINSTLRCMDGTQAGGRCNALLGTIGEAVGCSIHTNRPSVCRDFPAAWVDGDANERCDRARARFGLPPLTPEDWMPHHDGGHPLSA